MIIDSEQEMLNFAKNFTWAGDAAWGTPGGAPATTGEDAAAGPAQARVIELIGDVGAGKTTFVRGLAKGLGITEPITSPSFTISKTYALPAGGNLIHYDFYRLSDPGLMLDDLEENLKNPKNIVIVEWAESISDVLPKNKTVIKIKYTDNGTREVIL
ncbi:tRNA (adenosine(37)-N6)-threonylcarbamoyltransferase complex ATPase subunit type 1 TsaE [Candidatus Saccharibacteria bacterium]|nr:tRNA (adenosine(37)-N6)-threonylcarbamoyltransferase complex ATPase subunit type 1 TsaE [Candidatus Saccharibacteria bacterium]